VRSDACVTGRGVALDPYHVLEFPDWVNVVALTPDNAIVLVHEYRHGAGRVMTGLPSGGLAAGEPPIDGARRELHEETGYAARALIALGSCSPNPANHNNRCHSFLALDAAPRRERALDPGEDIAIETMPLERFAAALASGAIELQALHLAALFMFERALAREHDLAALAALWRR
jgi:8-oxo-dGTP pyrophosphatase MutT (NUDIX family)